MTSFIISHDCRFVCRSPKGRSQKPSRARLKPWALYGVSNKNQKHNLATSASKHHSYCSASPHGGSVQPHLRYAHERSDTLSTKCRYISRNALVRPVPWWWNSRQQLLGPGLFALGPLGPWVFSVQQTQSNQAVQEFQTPMKQYETHTSLCFIVFHWPFEVCSIAWFFLFHFYWL